jgi:hypothetical protein
MTGVPSEQFCGYYVFVHVVPMSLNILEAEPLHRTIDAEKRIEDCHSREGGNPGSQAFWTPAFAGETASSCDSLLSSGYSGQRAAGQRNFIREESQGKR